MWRFVRCVMQPQCAKAGAGRKERRRKLTVVVVCTITKETIRARLILMLLGSTPSRSGKSRDPVHMLGSPT